MKDIFNNKKWLLSINIFLFILVIVLIFFLLKVSDKKIKNIITRDNNNTFLLTNPILDCEIDNSNNDTVVFSEDVVSRVKKLKDDYSLSHISLYFRDLNNGPWIGINEKEVFSPASLLKVPILMALLRQAEGDPYILNKKILIKDKYINKNLDQNVKPLKPLILNNEYSLSDISEDMIGKSDNTAVLAILDNINTNYVGDVFRSVGVPYKDIQTEVDVRVKDYAGFFRVLFNASYLNREMSERALEILSKSDYRSGLVAGVPKEITVAHKFGERTFKGVSGDTQLHDCGIIYYPKKPYILCIMTTGNSFLKQEQVIKDLSSYIYNKVDNND